MNYYNLLPDKEKRLRRLSVARAFHESHERLAPGIGYKTREESAVPWSEVPMRDKTLMMDVAHDLLRRGFIQ